MRTTDAPPRMKGGSVSRVEYGVGGAGDQSLKVRANFVTEKGDIHGTTERVGGWSPNVIAAAENFVEALESFLLAAHFDVGEEDDRSAERNTPKGILGA